MFSVQLEVHTFEMKLLSRKTLVGPWSRAYCEVLFTLAFIKACATDLGTVSYSNDGFKSMIATAT